MIIQERRTMYVEEYNRQFTRNGEYFGNGFSFPCDKSGNLCKDLTDAAQRNYEWALSHPEKFTANGIVKTTRRVVVPAINKCKCGYEFDLYSQYMGACECPACGQWYNLSGQELLPPNQWDKEY